MSDVLPAHDLIDGRLLPLEGEALQSRDPSNPDRIIWSGSPRAEHVEEATIPNLPIKTALYFTALSRLEQIN